MVSSELGCRREKRRESDSCVWRKGILSFLLVFFFWNGQDGGEVIWMGFGSCQKTDHEKVKMQVEPRSKKRPASASEDVLAL